jgi:hypothetical protein
MVSVSVWTPRESYRCNSEASDTSEPDMVYQALRVYVASVDHAADCVR